MNFLNVSSGGISSSSIPWQITCIFLFLFYAVRNKDSLFESIKNIYISEIFPFHKRFFVVEKVFKTNFLKQIVLHIQNGYFKNWSLKANLFEREFWYGKFFLIQFKQEKFVKWPAKLECCWTRKEMNFLLT